MLGCQLQVLVVQATFVGAMLITISGVPHAKVAREDAVELVI